MNDHPGARDLQLVELTDMAASVRACDTEPIHVPGSIQPHGVLLLFSVASEALHGWAGDIDSMLGVSPTLGMACENLIGVPLLQIAGPQPLPENQEPIYGGCIRAADGVPLSVVVHRTGPYIAVELEPAAEPSSAALMLDRVRRLSALISGAPNLQLSSQRAAEEVQRITGYDRIMIYRFLDDQSGAVVAEALSGNAKSYLGHRFPASDIPAQARELYRRSLIRVIPDVSYTPAPIQPASECLTIDMSHSTLRSVSPVHMQYLNNMKVGASMSVSLLVNGRLWGLIACHSSGARRVPIEAQLLCRHVGAALSTYIQNEYLVGQARRSLFHSSALEQVLGELRGSADPERTLRASAEGLIKLVDADGLALLAGGELIAGAGRLPEPETIRRFGSLIEPVLVSDPSFSSHHLQGEFGDPEALALASGMLAVRIEAVRPLTALWTRAERVEEVTWAGAPPMAGGAPGRRAKPLTPRRSFATWRQIVRGHSRPWDWEEKHVVELFKSRAEFILQKSRLEQVNKSLFEANAHLDALATTDFLTGLPNRRLFDEKLRVEWERCLRSRQKLAFVSIDVDNFKKFNDHFGHPAGDDCLRRVAQALRGSCRFADVAARIGGEEFALLLSDVDDGGAIVAAERVRRAVEELGIAHPLNETGVVTISLGLAEGMPQDWGNLLHFLEAADQALYQAKAQGRNRAVVRSVEN